MKRATASLLRCCIACEKSPRKNRDDKIGDEGGTEEPAKNRKNKNMKKQKEELIRGDSIF